MVTNISLLNVVYHFCDWSLWLFLSELYETQLWNNVLHAYDAHTVISAKESNPKCSYLRFVLIIGQMERKDLNSL